MAEVDAALKSINLALKWGMTYIEIRTDLEIVQIGEEVWVKLPDTNCTAKWRKGVVPGVQSPNNVLEVKVF